MNALKNIQTRCHLFSELSWSERHAGHPAFIIACLVLALSMASNGDDETPLARNPTASGKVTNPAVLLLPA